MSEIEFEWTHVYPVEEQEHELSQDCWCQPTLDYRDPVTGVEVWVHREYKDTLQ